MGARPLGPWAPPRPAGRDSSGSDRAVQLAPGPLAVRPEDGAGVSPTQPARSVPAAVGDMAAGTRGAVLAPTPTQLGELAVKVLARNLRDRRPDSFTRGAN